MSRLGPKRGRGSGRVWEIFKCFSGKFVSKVSMRFSKSQKGSVNLTCNAFLHRKSSSWYIIVPSGHEGIGQILSFLVLL